MKSRNHLLGALLALSCGLLLSACTEEDPTSIGGALLPDGQVVTFQVILEPEQYLVLDTAFSGYVNAYISGVRQLMGQFEGVTDAHLLYRFGLRPTALQVRDPAGAPRTDTLISFPTGYLLLRLDTLRARGAGTIAAYQTAETWDAPTATWTVRADTGGPVLNWQQPGGTRGDLIGTTAWTGSGPDSVTIPLDSLSIELLTDTANVARGLLLAMDQAAASDGASLRVISASLRLSGKSTIQPDTTVIVTLDVVTSAMIFSPDPPETVSSGPRVSGVPAWRSILAFRDDLKEILLPCPGTNCTVRLADVHVNLAELLLQPTGSPPGFAPEDSIRVVARTLLEAPGVPLARSPIGDPAGVMRRAIDRARFRNDDTGPPAGLAITDLIGGIAADTATVPERRVPRRVALFTNPEAFSFGFASFQPGPRLRLVLTISGEELRP